MIRNQANLAVCALVLAGGLFGIPARADETKYPIDTWMAKEIKKNPSTMGMRRAMSQAREKWEQEMERAYQNLLKHLNASQKDTLITSQKAWVAFRDAEYDTNASIVGRKRGTLWSLVAGDNVLQVARTRAIQLKAYERLVSGNSESDKQRPAH